VATTCSEENLAIVKCARKIGVKCFVDEGNEEDVLGRFVRTVEWARENGLADAANVIRVTGESPLHYLENIEDLVRRHDQEKMDMSYTALLPLGAFLEVISVGALRRAYFDYGTKYHEPRVTLAMKENQNEFRVLRVVPERELQRPEVRLSVDTPEDLIVMREIYRNLNEDGRPIKIGDAIKFLDQNPEISKVSRDVVFGAMARIWD
jgi:spore coat polysaccharide biosynthesis protein SpsF